MIAETARSGNPSGERVAVALYAIVGALLCRSWLAFFSHLARHPELFEDQVEESYFARQRPRALAGVVLYLAAGTAGVLTDPLAASVIFLLLPVFCGLTSHGFAQWPTVLPRFGRNRLPKGD